ncbi:hypothetical protein JTB14_022726 [Gonioctena quinquepunctata]|nr:hypothetical protein JTB14_022726 [Gonioctena quinquepunctata]
MTALYLNSDRVKLVLGCMWKEFWPQDLADGTREIFRSGYSSRLSMMIFLITSGGLFTIGCLVTPLFGKNRELPYKSVYSFDYRASPSYEIIYFLHIIVIAYVINMTVCGFDFLFMGISAALTNQYVLLGRCFEKFGTAEMLAFNTKMDKLDYEGWKKCHGAERRFLSVCVKHHQLLIRSTGVVEEIFNMVASLQLFSSIIAICVSGFIATKVRLAFLKSLVTTKKPQEWYIPHRIIR